MKEEFKKWLREQGLDPDRLAEEENADQRKVLEGIWKRHVLLQTQAETAGADANARLDVIMNTARAAVATAEPIVRSEVLDFAADIAGDLTVTAADAQRKITEKLSSVVAATAATEATRIAEEQTDTRDFAVPADPDAVLSRADIGSAFGEQREDRSIYRRAAESVITHARGGNRISMRELTEQLEGRTGTLRVHDEEGVPQVRTILAASINVAMQNVLTNLLEHSYMDVPSVTDALVTAIHSTAAEDTLPEIDTEKGAKLLLEGETYPMISGSERSVMTSHKKAGVAIAQTRENNVFDRLGRVGVHLRSIARQLRDLRDKFRLARICDSTDFDGKYCPHPGDNDGDAAFYSTTEDYRGNANLKESNALADYTDIDAVVLMLESMQLNDDSYVMTPLRQLLVPSELKATAWKIINSVYCPPTGADTANPMQVNPYGPEGMYSNVPQIISHPLVATYAGATTTWLAGDFAAQFIEKIVWDTEVVPVTVSGAMELKDIVSAWKASWCVDVLALSNMHVIESTA